MFESVNSEAVHDVLSVSQRERHEELLPANLLSEPNSHVVERVLAKGKPKVVQVSLITQAEDVEERDLHPLN